MEQNNEYEIIKKIIWLFFMWDLKHNFFIVNGQKNIWKINFIKKILKEKLWIYYKNDLLFIKDLSKLLWKKHNIKVSTNEIIKTEEWNYTDLWTREMNTWLTKWSVSGKKILLIENINRMWVSAMNSFLKSCEDVNKNILILATTYNIDNILTTIISRAIIINIINNSFNNEDIKKISLFNSDKDLLIFFTYMSIWQTDILKKINTLALEDNEFKKNIFKTLDIFYYNKKQSIIDKYNIFIFFKEKNLLDFFIDWLINFFTIKQKFNEAIKYIEMKKIMQTNVNKNNIILYYSL